MRWSQLAVSIIHGDARVPVLIPAELAVGPVNAAQSWCRGSPVVRRIPVPVVCLASNSARSDGSVWQIAATQKDKTLSGGQRDCSECADASCVLSPDTVQLSAHHSAPPKMRPFLVEDVSALQRHWPTFHNEAWMAPQQPLAWWHCRGGGPTTV